MLLFSSDHPSQLFQVLRYLAFDVGLEFIAASEKIPYFREICELDFFPVFYLPSESMLAALGLAALTGFLSGIVPAVTGLRLKATEALRSV